jgi:hypothetical protein
MRIPAPIVFAKRLGGVQVQIQCPFCKTCRGKGKPKVHFHGSGSHRGPYLGHRLAHCCDNDLPEQLRRRVGISLGYYIVCLAGLHMTEGALMSLFEEMDSLADELPRGMAFKGDCQIEFRQLQKHRFPHLETDQWLDLFALWCVHYQARDDAKRAATRSRMDGLVEERRNLFIARTFLPPSAATAAAHERLLAIGRELAELCTPIEPPPSGEWAKSVLRSA